MKKSILIILTILLISCSKDNNDLINSYLFGSGNFNPSTVLPEGVVLSFNPSTINFGTVQNGTSTTKQITISNSFGYPVDVTATHISSITSLTYNIINFQIPANGTYVFDVTFSPITTMFLNDTLHFSYNNGNTIQNVNVLGNSVATLPTTLVVTPTGTIDFGNIIVGQTATRNITLLNTGSASASWTPVGTTLSFNPVNGNIPAGNSQIVAMSIIATGSGVYSNTQTISYNGGTVQIPYTVNRIAATRIIGVSCTTSTAFGNIPINTTSSKIISISNTGNSPLNVTSITVQSPSSNQFTCSYAGVIAPNTSVNVPISFKPTSTGSKSCSIIVQSDKTAGTNNLTFTGFGI